MNKYLLLGMALGISFLWGRHSAPTKTITVEKEKIIYQSTEQSSESKNINTQKIEIIKPNGTKITKTKTLDLSQKNTSSKTTELSTKESTKTTEHQNKNILSIFGNTQTLGISYQHNLIGPFFVGLQISSNKNFNTSSTLSLGISF